MTNERLLKPSVSVIVPALNEEQTIPATLQAIRKASQPNIELIVVDDGSRDQTYNLSSLFADRVIRNHVNMGKGKALMIGSQQANADIIVFIDADLGETAVYWERLLLPILNDELDMTIAAFSAPEKKGGFGLVKGLAYHGIYRLSGYKTGSPLSGQRAMRKQVLAQIGSLAHGFGIEVGLTIDAAKAGFRIGEVQVEFRHRETGRDLKGFYHRGKQFIAVGRTLWTKWKDGRIST